MDEVNDQVQQDSPEEGQAEAEQSETSTSEQELYELPDGRKVDPETLSKEWKENFYPEFTKRSQELKELRTKAEEWEKSAQLEAAKAVAESDHLKDVDPSVREAIVQIVTPVIENKLRQRDAEEQRKAQDIAFTQRLEALEKKYKGGDGLPKFDRVKVLAAMQDPSNSTFDPETKFKELNEAAFIDYYVKQAMKGKASDVKTEDTGTEQARKPEGKTPKSWEDATNRAISRIVG